MELSEISKVLEKHDPSFNRFDFTLSYTCMCRCTVHNIKVTLNRRSFPYTLYVHCILDRHAISVIPINYCVHAWAS